MPRRSSHVSVELFDHFVFLDSVRNRKQPIRRAALRAANDDPVVEGPGQSPDHHRLLANRRFGRVAKAQGDNLRVSAVI
jgi:hypothetical protein